MSNANCRFCQRKDLAMLPMRIAYAPQGAGYLPGTLPNSLSQQEKLPQAALQDGQYTLRVINEGYIYLFDQRAGGFWRVFAATADGLFYEIIEDIPPREQPKFTCNRAGHNLSAALINIKNPDKAHDVWVGYSRVWLTSSIRKKYKTDASLRKKWMVQINPAALLGGVAPNADAGVKLENGEQLTHLAGEYLRDKKQFDKIASAFAEKTSRPAINRGGLAEQQIAHMKEVSNKHAILLALPDFIGCMQDANAWRNAQAGELAKYQAQENSMRTRIVGDLILQLKTGMEKQGQAKTWQERYEPKLDMKRVNADKAAHDKKIQELDQAIQKASHDWCVFATSPLFEKIWDLYDGKDKKRGPLCGAQMERDMAHCVFGSGATREEQTWWKHWLAQAPNNQHPIWRALSVDDPEVLAFLIGGAVKPFDIGKIDKGFETTKSLYEGAEAFEHWLHKRHAAHAIRPAQAESGMLTNTAAAQLQLIARTQPEQALVAGMRMRIVIATRLETIVTPRAIQMTMQQFVLQMHETVWGPPRTQIAQTIQEARSLKIAQTMQGAWLGSKFTSQRMVILDVWLPEEATALGMPKQAAIPRLPVSGLSATAAETATMAPLNPWQGMHEYLKSFKGVKGAINAGILGIGSALQIINLTSSLIQLERAHKSDGPKTHGGEKHDAEHEAIGGIVSGSLGLTGITFEIAGSAMEARIIAAVAQSAGNIVLARAALTKLAGGFFGAAAAVVEGVHLWGKAQGLNLEGDKDAASAYIKAAISTGFLAAFSFAVAIIKAGSALAAAEATGTIATTIMAAGSLLSVIPVWGWIILAIGAIGASVYYLYQAAKKEDTPLEKWFSRCIYRNSGYVKSSRKPYERLEEEMREFQLVFYGLTAEVYWNDRLGKDEVEIRVVMPGFSSSSEYAFLLELNNGRGKRTIVLRQTSSFSQDFDLKPQRTEAVMSAIHPGEKLIPLEDVVEIKERLTLTTEKGVATLTGKVLVNEDYYNHAKIKIEYWPDPAQSPDLVFTPVPAGAEGAMRNSVEVKD